MSKRTILIAMIVCDVASAAPVPETLDDAAIADGVRTVSGAVTACNDGTHEAKIVATLEVAPDGRVRDVELDPAGTSVHACLERALRRARFAATRRGDRFSESFEFNIYDPPLGGWRPPPCAPAKDVREGQAKQAAGDHVEAVQLYQRAQLCSSDPAIRLRLVVGACHLKTNLDRVTAVWHYARLPAQLQAQAEVECASAGITKAQLLLVCDATALAEQGRRAAAAARWREAEHAFDDAALCRFDPGFAREALVAACNIPDLTKARWHWGRIPAAQREPAPAACTDNGITRRLSRDHLTGSLQVIPIPPANVFIDDKEVGTGTLDLLLPAGSYRVRFEAAGYKTAEETTQVVGGVRRFFERHLVKR